MLWILVFLFLPKTGHSQAVSKIKDPAYLLVDSLIREGESVYEKNPDRSIAIWKDVVVRINKILKAKTKYRNDFEILLGDATSNIAFVYQMKGDIKLALEYGFKAIAIREKANDKHGVAESNNNLGYAFMEQGDSVAAIEAYSKSGRIYAEIKDFGGVAYSGINISRVYFATGRYDEAMFLLKRSDFILDSLGQFLDARASAMSLQAEIYIKLNRLDSAQALYERALNLAISVKDDRTIASCYANLGNLFFKLNKIDKAQQFAEKGVEYARINKIPETMRFVAEVMSRVYLAKGDFKRGYEFFKLSVDQKERISNESNRKDLVKKQFAYQYDKKMAEIKAVQREKEKLHEAERSNERTRRYALMGILALVLIFSGFMYTRFRIIRKQKVVIEDQKILVEEKNKEVRDSILYARRIQSALLAHADLLQNNLAEHFVFFKPKDIVSGDFYWACRAGNRFYLAVCDSTGHGVPGAFMSLLNISYLNEAINEKNITRPDEIFNHVRQRLIENVSNERMQNEDGSFDDYGGRDGMDGTLLCFEDGKNEVSYTAAHHRPLLVRNGAFIELASDKMPVGKSELAGSFSAHSIQFQKGDTLYLYTDGYTDQFGGEKGKKFKTAGIKRVLEAAFKENMQKQRELFHSTFDWWKGDMEQIDDVCVVGIRL
ncbi:MAG: tetratricopeptide repeat protein [Flavobacteriales bacterium]